jgi:hypothetical protein
MKINLNNKLKEHTELECDSCFGGLAIFKTKKLKGIRYKGNINEFPKNFFKKDDLIKTMDQVSKYNITFDINNLASSKNYNYTSILRPGIIKQDEICEHIYYNLTAKKIEIVEL